MHLLVPLCCLALLSASEPADADAFGSWLEDNARAIAADRVTASQIKTWQADGARRPADERHLIQVLVGIWTRQSLQRPDWCLLRLAPLAAGQRPLPPDSPPALGKDGKPQPWTALPVADPGTWPVGAEHALATAELCRCLAALGDLPAAIAITERWKAVTAQDAATRAILATGLIEGLLADARAEQAAELADLAHGSLTEQLAAPYGRTPARRLALVLLEPLRAEAHRRHDLERYGPAWVAYRDADMARMRRDDPFLAMVRYARVEKEFPQTVYATAARANRIVTQLLAARTDQADERLAWVERQRKRTAELVAAHDELARTGLKTPASLARYRTLIAEQEEMLAAAAKWPVAPRKLADSALAEAQAFIAAEPDGLYRGDVLMARADWCWEEEGDAATAAKLYDETLAWLARAPARDAAIDGFAFDERIRKVAAPPPAAITKDEWGNIRWSAIPPGTIVNHRTCPWLVGHQTMRAAARRGLCAFAMGRRDEALRYIDELARHDPFEQLRQQGDALVSNASRLRDGFARGGLFATEEELALFQGRERALLLTAELCFECEDWDSAERAYAAVLARFGDRLKPDQRTYVLFQTANCHIFRRGVDRSKALAILRPLSKEATGSPTWPRIQLALWNILRWRDETEPEALVAIDRLLATRLSPELRDETLFHKAFHFWQGPNKELDQWAWATLRALTKSQVEWVRLAATNWLAHPEYVNPDVKAE